MHSQMVTDNFSMLLLQHMALTTIFENRKGASLETLLADPEFVQSIKFKRILYVLKPAMETDIIKFGIAGHGSGTTTTGKPYNENSAFNRLNSYLTQYGRTSDCRTRQSKEHCNYGVKLYLILGNRYSSKVSKPNSAVFRKESYMKHVLKSSIQKVGRGQERTDSSIGTVLKYALDNKFSEDHATDMELKSRLR